MNELLSNILHMSLTGSIVILVVMSARMIMKKMPKKYMYLLWAVVGFRLLCPVTLESSFSIFNIRPIRNSVEQVRDLPLITYGSAADTASSAATTGTARVIEHAVTSGTGSINYAPVILTALWAAVAVGILVYVIYQYIVMRRSLNGVRQIAPGLYSGHEIDSPFVMGIIRPRIYMPAGLTRDELEYLVLHEKTHIRRGDVFFKIIGLAAVSLHWFNPLVWIAYSMFVQDMEMSCDEEVIARLGAGVKTEYSMSLVSFARKSNGSKYIVVPVAFSNKASGGKEVKMRIKNVLGYKGTSKLVTTLALVLVAGVGLVCLFNARTFADENEDIEVAEETSAEDICETEVVDEIAETEAGDNGMEVTIEGEDGPVTYVPDDEETPAEEAVQPSSAVTDPADASQAQSSAIQMNSDNILETAVPVLTGIDIDAELNIPEGTKVEDHPELDRYIAPGQPVESDVYAIYYKHAPDQATVDSYIAALAEAGFTHDNYSDVTGYSATNSDGLTVIVEYVPDCDYFRVAFYTLVDGTNMFARLG
ncbi:MAG: hypothetical protein J6Z43_11160 [Clostridiales bacterium]|nr:hypothetical protein [Clostridiales bacterium]